MTTILHLAETTTGAICVETADAPSFVDQGSLDLSGHPLPSAEELVARVLEKCGGLGGDVALMVPPQLVHSRTLSVEVPVHGMVTQAHVLRAFRAIDDQIDDHGTVTLYRQPSSHVVDGIRSLGDPVGKKGKTLTIHVTLMTTPVRAIAQFERVVTEAGAVLADVITPQLALPAAVLDESGTGMVVHVGFGETVISRTEDHQVVASGLVPIGLRHLTGDVMKTCGVAAGEARPMIDLLLAASPDDEMDLTGQVLDARIEELGERVAAVLNRFAAARDVVVTGALGRSRRVHRIWDPLIGQPLKSDQSADIPSASLPLMGARLVLNGEWGVHERARLVRPTSPYRGHKVVRWLQAHF